MVEVTIVGVDEASPKASGDYIQVITRRDQTDPGKFVSDIEHFTLKSDGSATSNGRNIKDIGFKDAIEHARDYAEKQGVDQVYATDRTAADME